MGNSRSCCGLPADDGDGEWFGDLPREAKRKKRHPKKIRQNKWRAEERREASEGGGGATLEEAAGAEREGAPAEREGDAQRSQRDSSPEQQRLATDEQAATCEAREDQPEADGRAGEVIYSDSVRGLSRGDVDEEATSNSREGSVDGDTPRQNETTAGGDSSSTGNETTEVFQATSDAMEAQRDLQSRAGEFSGSDVERGFTRGDNETSGDDDKDESVSGSEKVKIVSEKVNSTSPSVTAVTRGLTQGDNTTRGGDDKEASFSGMGSIGSEEATDASAAVTYETEVGPEFIQSDDQRGGDEKVASFPGKDSIDSNREEVNNASATMTSHTVVDRALTQGDTANRGGDDKEAQFSGSEMDDTGNDEASKTSATVTSETAVDFGSTQGDDQTKGESDNNASFGGSVKGSVGSEEANNTSVVVTSETEVDQGLTHGNNEARGGDDKETSLSGKSNIAGEEANSTSAAVIYEKVDQEAIQSNDERVGDEKEASLPGKGSINSDSEEVNIISTTVTSQTVVDRALTQGDTANTGNDDKEAQFSGSEKDGTDNDEASNTSATVTSETAVNLGSTQGDDESKSDGDNNESFSGSGKGSVDSGETNNTSVVVTSKTGVDRGLAHGDNEARGGDDMEALLSGKRSISSEEVKTTSAALTAETDLDRGLSQVEKKTRGGNEKEASFSGSGKGSIESEEANHISAIVTLAFTQDDNETRCGDDKEASISGSGKGGIDREAANNTPVTVTSESINVNDASSTENETKEDIRGGRGEATALVSQAATTKPSILKTKNESETKSVEDLPSIEHKAQEVCQSGGLEAATTTFSSDEIHSKRAVQKEKLKDESSVSVLLFGDTFGELTKALHGREMLYGILATSGYEMTSNEAVVPTLSVQHQENNLVAFTFEYEVENNKFWKEADVIEKHSSFKKFHPIVWSTYEDAKYQILQHLGAPENAAQETVSTIATPAKVSVPTTTSKKKRRDSRFSFGNFQNSIKDMSIYSSATVTTAFKHACSCSDTVPSGEEILRIVRQPLGHPYNWVLFEPSETGLIVKDAGSGSVVELTTVLRQCYNDCVLFGLLRLSFVGSRFGRRQMWCGLEWKGEECYSVRMIRQLRNCHDPMMSKIGDRAFDISSVAAGDMTPEMVVERVKRSLNNVDFDVTVEAMQKAQEEEQRDIKCYWQNVEKERMERQQQQEKEQQLRKVRQNEVSVTKLVRESRRARWAKMSVTELLQDFGKDDMPGWVLFEKKKNTQRQIRSTGNTGDGDRPT